MSIGVVDGYNLTFHKVSKDGSGKCDMGVSKNAADSVYGVLFEIDVADETELDRYEGSGYTKKTVHVSTATGLKDASVYIAITTNPKLVPYHWYKDLLSLAHGSMDCQPFILKRFWKLRLKTTQMKNAEMEMNKY